MLLSSLKPLVLAGLLTLSNAIIVTTTDGKQVDIAPDTLIETAMEIANYVPPPPPPPSDPSNAPKPKPNPNYKQADGTTVVVPRPVAPPPRDMHDGHDADHAGLAREPRVEMTVLTICTATFKRCDSSRGLIWDGGGDKNGSPIPVNAAKGCRKIQGMPYMVEACFDWKKERATVLYRDDPVFGSRKICMKKWRDQAIANPMGDTFHRMNFNWSDWETVKCDW